MNFSPLFSRYQTHFNLFSLNRSMILTNTSTRKSAVNTWEHILLQPPRSLWKQNHDRLLWLLWEQKCLLLYHEVFYPVWHLNERKNKLNEKGLKLPFWGTGTKISSKTRLTVHRSCLLSLIVYVFIILDYFIFLWRGSVKQNASATLKVNILNWPCSGSSGRPAAVSLWHCGFGPGTSLGPAPPLPGPPAASPSPAPALSFASTAWVDS